MSCDRKFKPLVLGQIQTAADIPLSVSRSIAVDSAVHVYGTPFFVEADLPFGEVPYRRTMIAQDAGSAIPGRAVC